MSQQTIKGCSADEQSIHEGHLTSSVPHEFIHAVQPNNVKLSELYSKFECRWQSLQNTKYVGLNLGKICIR